MLELRIQKRRTITGAFPMPKVSVIMACYNEERYIEDAIQSILNQTYSNFELVIVDDASTDGTVDKIKNFSDNRIRLVETTKNTGPSSCWNLAAENSVGDYIAVMDADDVSLEKRLEIEKEFLDENPNYGLVGTNWIEVDENLNPIRPNSKFESYGDIRKALLFGNAISNGTAMFRRKLFNQVGGYGSSDKLYMGDYGLFLRMCSISRAKNIQEYLCLVRVNPSQRTSEFQPITDRLQQRFHGSLTALRLLNYSLGEIFQAVKERWTWEKLKKLPRLFGFR